MQEPAEGSPGPCDRPLTWALLRPVISPVSESPSEKPMLSPAPIGLQVPRRTHSGSVSGQGDGEDRRERRERAVDQAGHSRLHALEQKRSVMGGRRDRYAHLRREIHEPEAPLAAAVGLSIGSRSIPRRWKKAPNEPASIATIEIAYA